MPKRVAPRYYEEGPYFFGPQVEYFLEGVDVNEPAQKRDALGRFTFGPTRVKDPTATINPPRPRTTRGAYDPSDRTLRLQFRNGRVYGYYDVPPEIWRSLRQVASTGRFINRRLDPFFEYGEEWPVDL